MPSEIPPLRPQSQTANSGLTGPAGGGVRGNQTDRRGSGGGGASGGGSKEPEPEAPEAPEEEEGSLDHDSFFSRSKGPTNPAVFDGRMPWEVDEKNHRARLDELARRRREGQRGTGPLSLNANRQSSALPLPAPGRGTGPLSAAAAQGPAQRPTPPQPPARPGTGPLPANAGAPSFNAEAAAAQTWQALQGRSIDRPDVASAPASPTGGTPAAPNADLGAYAARAQGAVPPPPAASEPPPAARPQTVPVEGSPSCLYRVVDGATQAPLGGARLEMEPVHDDLLPVQHGMADPVGVFRLEQIPPGVYRVTVRAPGYIPVSHTQTIERGRTDQALFVLKRPNLA